jgi:hypothetical protein
MTVIMIELHKINFLIVLYTLILTTYSSVYHIETEINCLALFDTLILTRDGSVYLIETKIMVGLHYRDRVYGGLVGRQSMSTTPGHLASLFVCPAAHSRPTL